MNIRFITPVLLDNVFLGVTSIVCLHVIIKFIGILKLVFLKMVKIENNKY